MNGKKTRREFLRDAFALGLGLVMADRLWAAAATPVDHKMLAEAAAAAKISAGMKRYARSVIYVSLDGGSSQTDTFDPKPDAGRDYFGNYKNPLDTNVPGTIIGEKLPRLAKIADRYSILRGMTIATNAHETAHYRMLTGDMTGGEVVYPSFGAMLSYLREAEYDNPLFPYMTLTASSTRFNEAGFLAPKYKPYDTGGDPSLKFFDVDGIYDHTLSDDELQRRRSLLDTLSDLGEKTEQTSQTEALSRFRDQDYRLILGDARRAFDLSGEPQELRDQYGMTSVGQSCLVARKLVQHGVLMTVVRFRGWDTHKEHFKRMDQRLEELDKGVASLILDLERNNLLDSTIVIVGGEFGRTPRIAWGPPWNGGRGHWGDAFSYLVAGGGFAGGKVVGVTDPKSEKVVDRKIYPADLWASVYTLMGIDPRGTVRHPSLGEIPLLPSLGKENQSNGMLTEIMPKS